MNRTCQTRPSFGVVLALVLAVVLQARSAEHPSWRYTLLPGSELVDDCYCGRPTITVPIEGSFDLRLIEQNPIAATYAVTNLWFEARSSSWLYRVTGHGRYQIGGEVAVSQEMFLETRIDNGTSNKLCYLTNEVESVQRRWPMLQVRLMQTNGALIQFYRLHLFAAPVREIWFSTVHGFTPGIPSPDSNQVSGGALVSSLGRVVKYNADLTARLGIMPVVPDLGLDAVEILPGGEVAFSMEQDVFSETLGPLHEGDVVSDRGRVITNYAALIGAFTPRPPPADQGLDALQESPSGEFYFSVERDFFSETLGRLVHKGDLLASSGVVLKGHAELIAPFNPVGATNDYGLDAIYVWPSGEVWFSVETGFSGQHFENYGPGDLLSDQGYVVARNLELLRPFGPREDLADFGLDALFVVTDATPLAPGTPGPRFNRIILQRPSGDVTFDWTGAGRLFQVEKATNVFGPWLPLSPILTEPPTVDRGALSNAPAAFYRLRQW